MLLLLLLELLLFVAEGVAGIKAGELGALLDCVLLNIVERVVLLLLFVFGLLTDIVLYLVLLFVSLELVVAALELKLVSLVECIALLRLLSLLKFIVVL